MLDQLIKLVQQNAGDEIIRNPAIPDEKNNAAVEDVARNIVGGLKDQVSGGNVDGLLSMFNNAGGTASTGNPLVTQLISRVAGSLASKFGVSPQTAQQIASGILPRVLGQFAKKTKDPGDNDFDLQDVLKNLTGNSNLNVGDLLGSFTGGGSDKGGIGGALGKMFGS